MGLESNLVPVSALNPLYLHRYRGVERKALYHLMVSAVRPPGQFSPYVVGDKSRTLEQGSDRVRSGYSQKTCAA